MKKERGIAVRSVESKLAIELRRFRHFGLDHHRSGSDNVGAFENVLECIPDQRATQTAIAISPVDGETPDEHYRNRVTGQPA